MATPSAITPLTNAGSKLPPPLLRPLPLPLPVPSIADTRLAMMLKLWPAPHCAPNAYDEKQSLAVNTSLAQDQLQREGVLMTFKVGLERINAIFDRAIQNKMRLPPRLP